MTIPPRFGLHERVETPRHGVGRIVTVWPRRGCTTQYSVAVDGKVTAIVFDEKELRAAAPAIANPVYCHDCAHSKISHFAPNTVRCAIYRCAKAAASPRECRAWRARETAA
jgi:hypothetical protein